MRRMLLAALLVVALPLLPALATAAPTPPAEVVADVDGWICKLAPDGREQLLYVAAIASDDTESYGEGHPDILAVVDANPDSETYGEIVHTVPMPHAGDNLHHYGYNHDRTKLLVPGLYSDRVHILDVADPARPKIERVYDDLAADSGYRMPHAVWGQPDGTYLVSMLGSGMDGAGPGGMVVLDRKGTYRQPFGPPANRNPRQPKHTWPQHSYDFVAKPEINQAVSTGFGPAAMLYDAWDNLDAGKGHIYIWDYEAQRVIQVFDAGDGNATTEARWLRDPQARAGFTHTANGQLWLFEDFDGDGVFDFHHVADVGALVLDITISYDDRWLYTSDYAGSVSQYDIADPRNPRLVAQVPIPFSGMMRLSLDGTRLYVTNSVIASLDEGPATPLLSPFNKGYGLFMIDVDAIAGDMTLSTDFFVDFNDVRLSEDEDGAEIRGRAGPHMVMFDPSVDAPFGGHH